MQPKELEMTPAMREKMNEEIVIGLEAFNKVLEGMANRMPDTTEGIAIEKTVAVAIVTNVIASLVRSYGGDRLQFIDELLNGIKNLVINSLMESANDKDNE